MSFYGCTSDRHMEHDCLSHYYQTNGKRKFTADKWCDKCRDSFDTERYMN